MAEHEEHQGYHHGQQEPLGVQPVATATVVVTIAARTAARSRSHGVRTGRTPQTVVDLLNLVIRLFVLLQLWRKEGK